MNISQRNLFSILRAGAFDNTGAPPVEPMSAFKWRRLQVLVEAQNLTGLFRRGIEILRPQQPLDTLFKAEEQAPPAIQQLLGTLKNTTFANPLLNRKLHRIIDGERHSIDTSVETLEILQIIIHNLKSMLDGGLYLGGIIALGQYLRTTGHRVDFVKLETWLSHLHLHSVASLQGNILIALFGFEPDELPFIIRKDSQANDESRKATRIVLRTLNYTDRLILAHLSTSSDSRLLRRNLRYARTYISYAPLETISNLLRNLLRRFLEVEE